MAVLIPAILSKSPEEIEEKIKFLESIPEIEEVQIDFADGKFVPNATAMPREISGLQTGLFIEAHLMTQAPQNYFHDLELLRTRTLLLHYESFISVAALSAALNNAKTLGMGAGVAINPQTEISALGPLAADLDMVLIMGVVPGFQGQQFIPETLDRIAELRKKHPKMIIEVDGGVKLENFQSMVAHGADRIVVGSAIWQTKDPKAAIYEFLKKLK